MGIISSPQGQAFPTKRGNSLFNMEVASSELQCV